MRVKAVLAVAGGGVAAIPALFVTARKVDLLYGSLFVATLIVAFCLGSTGARADVSEEATVEPHAACGDPAPGRARCLAIIDPGTTAAQPVVKEATPAAACFVGEYEYCGTGLNNGLSPQDLQSAYRMSSSTGGAGHTVAIVAAYDAPTAQQDLNVYRSTYGLPPCEAGCFTKVDQEGGTNYPPPNSGWAAEISLDLDMVSSACPQCNILLVEAKDNMLSNLAKAVDTAASLGATEISNSYVAREISLGKAAVESYGASYNHPGIPITAASGDLSFENENLSSQNESGECTNCSPSFPAGLKSVLAVGGTHLSPSGESGRGWTESAWFYGGSGCALFVAKPSWQTDTGCKNRTVVDVAAEASTSTPVSVYDSYGNDGTGWIDVGGTSASAPLLAGFIALQSPAVRAEGIEGIYKHPTAWNDVTGGANYAYRGPCAIKYLCIAGVGYDGPTGVGTPIGSATVTPPSAVAEAASAVAGKEATLNGKINPEGSETTYYFQYGTSKAYGTEAPAGGAHPTGYTKPVKVTQAISGLSPGTLYHYRLVAKSAGGTTYGGDRSFSTPPKLFLSTLGSQGTADGQLEAPKWSATDGKGNLWVSDYTNNRIVEYGPEGEFLRKCGGPGSGNGQFNGPTGIAINPTAHGNRSGAIFVSDSGNDRVQVFEPNCTFLEAFGKSGSGPGNLDEPMGLAFGSSVPGYYLAPLVLMVADAGNNRLNAYNYATGSLAWKPGQFISSYGSLGSGNGQFKRPIGISSSPGPAKFTELYYVTDSGNNRVQVLETYVEETFLWKYLRQFGSAGSGNGQLSNPTGLAQDATTGDLAVVDTGNNRVQEFLPSGTYVAQFGNSGSPSEVTSAPVGISFDALGSAYVADTGNNRISVWRSAPQLTGWGVQILPEPAGRSSLAGVSCPTAASCADVGTSIPTHSFAESWAGATWSAQSPPNGAGPSYLRSVSCVSASQCMAVGEVTSYAGGEERRVLAEWWNGVSWTLLNPPVPTKSPYSGFNGVSCSSATYCVAVGHAGGWNEGHSLVERWNGSTWSIQKSVSGPSSKRDDLLGVSCTSSSSCMAVGYSAASSGALSSLTETWNGTSWVGQAAVNPAGSERVVLRGVSCPAVSSCAAVGEYSVAGGGSSTLAEGWNGTAWSTQKSANPGVLQNALYGVSCAAVGNCVAVGEFFLSTAKLGFAERWSGSEWVAQEVPKPENTKDTWLFGVSCPSVSVCNAAGTFYDLSGQSHPFDSWFE